MTTTKTLIAAIAMAICLPAAAQPQPLQGDAITESALIDALTPPPQVLTRSISRDRRPPSPRRPRCSSSSRRTRRR